MIVMYLLYQTQVVLAIIKRHSLLGIQKVLNYFDVASRIYMHSIVLTSTLAALNDPSYMYAALWAHNFILYPYKKYLHTI